eukprot:CAMPEP_0119349380 /NCGR_PEP_ID=MMETSP1333-20130426/109520_2 /TAXON_ID=418940 /ORGANISM="Scyphosphaera apsteinii, Strain RCC1455" /LENGTH=47 /DNA_ID= /DNA_START= /DNA_END= /DNA_ORIENTATION=
MIESNEDNESDEDHESKNRMKTISQMMLMKKTTTLPDSPSMYVMPSA